MSDSNGPVNRRRIAGESNPVAKKTTVKKGPAKKTTANKAAAKKSPAKSAVAKQTAKKAAVVKPTAKKAPAKAPVARPTAKKAPAKAPVARPTAKKAPAKKVSIAKVVPPAKVVAPKVASVATRPSPAPRPARSSDGQGKPSRRELGWLIPATLLALASLVIGGWLALRGVNDIRQDDGARASTEKAASSAASSAAETIFSYNFNELDKHLTDSQKLMTSTFAKDFAKIAPALDEIAPQRKVQVEAVSRNAAALSCGDECKTGTVNVLVFLDQARLVDGSKEPDVIGNRITMKMVQRDGRWLVDDVRAV